MSQPIQDYTKYFASIFSDETELFRTPAEPDEGDIVRVRIRVPKGAGAAVTLLLSRDGRQTAMDLAFSDKLFDWYEASFRCGKERLFYSFLLDFSGHLVHYNRLGPHPVDCAPSPDAFGAFQILPGFHVPVWSKGAVQYQIFPDRFKRGNLKNDVRNREYAYARGMIRHATAWSALPENDDYRCMYGGDLVGVEKKLDYLQDLGIEAIYLNPIFVSPSPHKYDTQDYEHIDPHLTVIEADGGAVLSADDHCNAHASLYIQRTTAAENLQKSDAWFAGFCQEIHRRGMKIILDGVFNHCGSFHRWLNREGIYSGSDGAYGNPESPYRRYFAFESGNDYHCWWGIDTLPKLCYEQSEALKDAIMKTAEKWASPPYSIDGWRLDVAADLGQSREYNHHFWKEFRRRVKAVNPEVLIIAEHYGDPSEWLRGDEWDTVMNYDAFMDPLSFFLTGMEKHSDYRRDDLYQNGEAFFHFMFEAMARLPSASLFCAMDELSNHDHSRFMTRTNGRVGRLHTVGSSAASEGIRPEVFREAAVIQMTWPGAPTIYYGDEAGLTGWTDPDNRRPYPWGHEDTSLIRMYRTLARLRTAHPVLRNGSIKRLTAGYGFIAYARFNAAECVITVCNNTEAPLHLELNLNEIGIPNHTSVYECYCTSRPDVRSRRTAAGKVSGGVFAYTISSQSASILTAAYPK